MAVARKIKTLLTVNILVFVGIILFSVYCRIQDRSEELIQLGRISDQRLRARNGKVSNLVDRQSILQRLERLEDVVYNQLNGRTRLHTLYSVNTGEEATWLAGDKILVSIKQTDLCKETVLEKKLLLRNMYTLLWQVKSQICIRFTQLTFSDHEAWLMHIFPVNLQPNF